MTIIYNEVVPVIFVHFSLLTSRIGDDRGIIQVTLERIFSAFQERILRLWRNDRV
jgi:hypothetical protein